MPNGTLQKRKAKNHDEWVCKIRRAKLPDPKVIGNAGSFFKNPTVSPEQCEDFIQRNPKVVHYLLADGSVKLVAGWLMDACGWKGRSTGNAGVYEKHALVLVNRGGADKPITGGEVRGLAKAIRTSVYEKFGLRLEPEPMVVYAIRCGHVSRRPVRRSGSRLYRLEPRSCRGPFQRLPFMGISGNWPGTPRAPPAA